MAVRGQDHFSPRMIMRFLRFLDFGAKSAQPGIATRCSLRLSSAYAFDRDEDRKKALGEAAMKRGWFSSGHAALFCSAAILGVVLTSSPAATQQFEVKPIAEKKVQQLPSGPLFWRIDNFPTLTQAQAAAGPTALAAEAAGKAWLFTLGTKGGSSPGGTKVAEIGPLPLFSAPQYLLRINNSSGMPGTKTPVHTHPGSETFYVLAGELSQKTPDGVDHIAAGQAKPGHGPGMPMEVSSSGTGDLTALVMFVTDASKPFSSPATMP